MITTIFKRQLKTLLFLVLLVGLTLFQSFNKVSKRSDTLQVFETPEAQRQARQMLSSFVNRQLDVETKNREEELSHLKTPAQWVARQEKTRGQLEEYFGKFPEKTPLNVRVVGKVDREQYKIEKIIIESHPNYFVTANLYVPKNRKLPLPGIIIPPGHEARAKSSWVSFGTNMALKGYVVLITDPMGQGERDEYPNVLRGVRQHHYIGRPSFLLNQTLSGLRVWDCLKAVDYLESRTEVDANKLGVVGVSGGGQMALLITAVDKRIKVCVASHPGGSMEATYLTGQNSIDREILSLVAPRPLRLIAGTESNEGPGHQRKLDDMHRFYEGLGYKKDIAELVMVPGKHGFSFSREPTYEFLNKFYGKEIEGNKEPTSLELASEQDIWCTPEGSTFKAGSIHTREVYERLMNKVYKPAKKDQVLKKRIANRIKLDLSEKRNMPTSKSVGKVSYGDISIEKLTYDSEEGITIPSLLITPKNAKSGSPVYLFVSDKGKPGKFEDTLLPFQLASNGYTVFAIDVRGTGEISPTDSMPKWGKYITYTPEQWRHDGLAIRSATIGRTMIGMRTFDLIRAVDFVNSRSDLKGRKVVAVGEGLGGLWASLGSVFDQRITGVATIGTLPSYKPLITNHNYDVNPGYFWLPGALLDFDIPDLSRLIASKPNLWIDPIGALGEKLSYNEASSMIKPSAKLKVINDGRSNKDVISVFEEVFK